MNISLGSKGVNAGMLVKIGVLWGVGPKAFSGGQYGVAWGMRSKADVLALFNSFTSCLKDAVYGPFDAGKLLLGHSNAARLSLSQGMLVRSSSALVSEPSSSKSSSTQPSSSK